MATLFNTKIKDTYIGLIKTSDNGNVTGSYKNLEDGSGNSIPVQVSTGGMKFTGILDAGSATSIVGLNSFRTVTVGATNLVADSVSGTLSISAGSGISLSANATTDAFVITNSSPNVDQNIFQVVNVNGTNLSADTTSDTLSILPGTGISLSANASSDTFVITNSSPNVDQNIFQVVNVNGTNLSADTTSDTLSILPGTGISLSANATSDTFVITNSSPNIVQNNFLNVNVNGTNLQADTSTDTLTIGQGTGIQLSANSASDTFNIILTATTTNVPEGSNLYYTDARVNTYLTGGTLEYIDFNTTDPQQEVLEGQMAFNTDEGSFDFGLEGGFVFHSGMQDLVYVKNQTGVQINKGQVVKAVGTVGSSGRILVGLFTADENTEPKYLIGIAGENIANGADGYVVQSGKIRGLNTGTLPEGAILWASPTTAGALTTTKPQAPNSKLPIAFVITTGTTNGEIEVRVTSGSDLNEDKRVELSSITNNQILQYKTNRFENVLLSAGTGISIVNNPTNIAISYTGASGGGVTSLEGLTGVITFSGTNINVGTSGNVITLSASTGGSGGSTNSFGTVSVPGQSSIVADQVNEVLNFTGTSGIKLTTTASTNTLYISQDIVDTTISQGLICYWDGTKVTGIGNLSYDSNTDEITFDNNATYFNGEAFYNNNASVVGEFTARSIIMSKPLILTPPNGDYGNGSKILKGVFTGTSLTLGQVYSVTSTGGLQASNSTSGNSKDLLCVAVNSSGNDGILIEGVVKVSTSLTATTTGSKVYLTNTNGGVSTTAPIASGSIVRIVGYVVEPGKSLIYFNPDNSWVENL
jgi:hypothetical protein